MDRAFYGKFWPAGLIAAVAAVAAVAPAAAHHSYGMFDLTRDQTITGSIVAFDWTNPHAWVHVAVKDDKGALRTWDIELGPPVSLVRRGWKRSTLKPGDTVEMVISPLKGGAPGGHLQSVKVASGQVLQDGFKDLANASNAAASAAAAN